MQYRMSFGLIGLPVHERHDFAHWLSEKSFSMLTPMCAMGLAVVWTMGRMGTLVPGGHTTAQGVRLLVSITAGIVVLIGVGKTLQIGELDQFLDEALQRLRRRSR